MKKKTPARTPRRSRAKTAVSVPKTQPANVPAVAAAPASSLVPAITASLDLPVGPDGLIDAVSAKFERYVMEQIRAGEKVCAEAKRQLDQCQQRFQTAAQRAAQRRAEAARPRLEEARRELNLTTPLQLDCEVSFDEQDDGLPQVSVTAKFFTERQPSGYSGWSYGDELRIEFRILLADMADDGNEPREAWEALQRSRQHHQQQTDLLITWRKKIAEIPYVQRQAKAHLTDVLLQQTEPGRQLYQSLQQQFQEFCQGVPEFCDDSLSA
jgi:hypothetical protein